MNSTVSHYAYLGDARGGAAGSGLCRIVDERVRLHGAIELPLSKKAITVKISALGFSENLDPSVSKTKKNHHHLQTLRFQYGIILVVDRVV